MLVRSINKRRKLIQNRKQIKIESEKRRNKHKKTMRKKTKIRVEAGKPAVSFEKQ